MKSTVLPLPTQANEKSTVPIFKIIFAKRSVFILFCLLLAGLSYLSAGCNILTYCSPFALALACAAPSEFLPAAVIGAAAGYLTAGYEIVPARYLSALILAVILKRIFGEKTAKNPLFCGIVALMCTAVSGILTSLLLDEVQLTLLPYTAESFIAAATAVFWAGSVEQIRRMKSLSALKESETACLLISIFLMILSLSYIKLYVLSLANILACLTILISAYYGKMGAGSLAGIGGGVALGFGNSDTFTFTGLSIGGLFAGLGASHSKLLSAIALEAGFAVPLLFGIGESGDYLPFAEAGIAVAVFLLIPKKVLNKYRFLNTQTYHLSAASVKTHTLSRLRSASDALSDVSSGIDDIGKKAASYSPAKKTMIYMNTVKKTCEKCGLKYYCWEKEKHYTVSIFKKMETLLNAGEELTPETLPNGFGDVCIRNKVLVKNFTLEHNTYVTNKLAAGRINAMREVMSIQFDALAQMLYDLSEDIEQKEILDAQMTDGLSDLLAYCGVDYLSAGVMMDRHFHIKVNIRIPERQEVLEKTAFLEDLQTICKRKFEAPQLLEYDHTFKLTYMEKADFLFEYGYYQICAGGNRYCGDSVRFIQNYEGKSAAIIADGMGNGLPANINGSLCAEMTAKLIASGFSVGSAIKTVNAALIVKDNDESFSSLDLMLFDRFSGKADFYKAGATTSILRHKNRIQRIELSSMPIGILSQADFAHTTHSLGDGDILVMLSDGATQGNNRWIDRLLIEDVDNDASALAKKIACTAKQQRNAYHEDDISVICIMIRDRAQAND